MPEILRRFNIYCRSLNFWLLAAFTATFIVYFCGMPRYLDDLWYAANLKEWREGLPGMDLWEGITSTWAYHLFEDNVRLSNILFVPFLALPKWVGSTLAAILWGKACVRGMRLVGVDSRHSPLLCVGLTLWAFLMPWYDGMGVENFQFNYIIPTFLAVTFLQLFLQDRPAKGAMKAAGLILTGFLIGLWHEGFTAPLIASAAWLMLSCPARRSRRQVFLLIGLTAGLIWFLAWPTSWHKVSEVYSETEKFGAGRFMFILMQHLNFIVLCLTLLICLCIRRMRPHLKDPLTIAILLSVAASLAIHFLTTRTPRTGWWCEFCSVLAVLRLLQQLFPLFAKKYNASSLCICIPLLLLTFAHQGAVCYWSLRINRNFNDAIERHLRSQGEVVFAEVADEYTSPLLCLYAPDFTTLLAPVNLYFINVYYHEDEERSFIPVPQELKNVTAESGTPVPPVEGGEDLRIRSFNGRLFMPTDEIGQTEFATDIDYGYTIRRGVRMIVYPFISEADGKRYAFLYPWRQVVQMRLGSIRAVSPTR